MEMISSLCVASTSTIKTPSVIYCMRLTMLFNMVRIYSQMIELIKKLRKC